MRRTIGTLNIRVGDDKNPIQLTDSAVEAVQDEAAGRAVSALAAVWAVEQKVEGGESFAGLSFSELLELRDALRLACEVTDVLIQCRPLDDEAA